MSPFLWYHRTPLTDREIELLLSRSSEAPDEHADLKWFLAALADQRPAPPHDVENITTVLASVARSSVPGSLRTRPRRAARRMVALAASFALLIAMSGIALAADDAAPGDLLYGIDRAFELIGIGDGGIEERISEFHTLIAHGDDEMAFEFLEEIVESSSEAESAESQTHRDFVADARAQVAENNVAEHQQFVGENKKDGVGADGKDFGQGVADIVSDRDTELPEQANGNKPDTPANKDKETGRPDDAAPPAEPPPQSKSNNSQSSVGDQGLGSPPETGSDRSSTTGNGISGGGNGSSANHNTASPDNTGNKDK